MSWCKRPLKPRTVGVRSPGGSANSSRGVLTQCINGARLLTTRRLLLCGCPGEIVILQPQSNSRSMLELRAATNPVSISYDLEPVSSTGIGIPLIPVA